MRKLQALVVGYAIALAPLTGCDEPLSDEQDAIEEAEATGKEDGGISLFTRCRTATQVEDAQGQTIQFTYETRPFTLLDEVVAVEVQRKVGSAAAESYGTVLLAETSPGRWVRGNMLAEFAHKDSGEPSIEVTHFPDGVNNWQFFASANNGWCERTDRPPCPTNETYGCSGGSCGCNVVGRTYAESLVANYDVTFTALMIGGVVTQALPSPVEDVPTAAIIFGTTVILVSFTYASGASWTDTFDAFSSMLGGKFERLNSGRELEDYYLGGGALAAKAEDVIRPVPPHDNANWPEGREAAGNAIVEAINQSTDVARETYECREANQQKHTAVDGVWGRSRALVGTAKNNGMPLEPVVRYLVQALEELAGTADPACAGLESELLQKLRNVLCKFYSILRPITPSNPTSSVALAKSSIETYFANNGYTCQ